MNQRALTRRDLLSGGGLAALAGVVNCQKREFSCLEPDQLPEPDFKARQAVGYVERAADAARRCDACQHWQPAEDDSCGGCAVLRGPIHPLGTCRVFTQRA